MFRHNKKASWLMGHLGEILIVIAVVAVAIGVFLPKILEAGNKLPELTACTASIGGEQGVCIPDTQYCSNKVNFGCKKEGEVCCFDKEVVAGAYVGQYCVCEDKSGGNVWQIKDLKGSEACKSSCIGGQESTYCPSGHTTNVYLHCVSNLWLNQQIACLDSGGILKSCSEVNDCLNALGKSCDFCRFDSTKCK